jgi:excisionase family DNA binding protein
MDSKFILKPITFDDIQEDIRNGVRVPDQTEVNECRDLLRDFDYDSLPKPQEQMLTIDEAADYAGVTQQTLRNWEKAGKLIPERTGGGHRRYRKSELIGLRKQQMSESQIILPDISPERFLFMIANLLATFDPKQTVTFTITQDPIERKVSFSFDSQDGLKTIVKQFNIKE